MILNYFGMAVVLLGGGYQHVPLSKPCGFDFVIKSKGVNKRSSQKSSAWHLQKVQPVLWVKGEFPEIPDT